MFTSSIIFAAVVALWATYLVLHTSRRREHMATARTVDRFSAEMRVLQRRAVKRAPNAVGRRTSVSLTNGALIANPASAPAAVVVERDDAVEAGGAGAARVGGRPVGVRRSFRLLASGLGAANGAMDSATTLVRRRPWTAARVRGIAFGVCVFALLATILTTGLRLTPARVVAVPVVLTVLVLSASRAAALAARNSRSRLGEATRQARRRATEAAEIARREGRPAAPTMPVAQEHVLDPTTREPVLVGARSVAGGGVSAEAAAQAAGQPFDLMAPAGGWEPVPVPPPVYTLKAKAERPLPAPLQVPDNVPVPIEVDDVFDEWAASL